MPLVSNALMAFCLSGCGIDRLSTEAQKERLQRNFKSVGKIDQLDAILAKDFALTSGCLAHHWKASLLCDFLTLREIRLYECFLWRRATAQPSHNPKDLCGYWPTAQVVKKDIGSKYYTVPWSWEIICSSNREEIKPDKCWQTFACSFSSSGV